MSDESFKQTKPRAISANHRRGLIGENPLIAVSLKKLSDPKPARIAPSFFCWQRVVGADNLIAVGHIRARAQKQRTVAGHMLQKPIIAIGHDLHMFGGDIICDLQHVLIAVTTDYLPIITPTDACGRSGRKDRQQAVDLPECLYSQFARIGHQNCGRIIAVLGLPQQISGAELGINCIIGNHHGFRGAGEKINSNPTKELALGFGHKGISGADQQVNWINALRAQRHGANGLNAAQHINLMRPAKMHCRYDGRIGLAVKRRGRGYDPRHPGNTGRGHRHMRRGDHWKFAPWNIAADRLHRDIFMTQNDTWQSLDFDVLQAVPLGLGKFAHLLLSKFYVGHIFGTDFCHQRLNFRGGEPIALAIIAIEFIGQFPNSHISACFNILQSRGDHSRRFCVFLSTSGI